MLAHGTAAAGTNRAIPPPDLDPITAELWNLMPRVDPLGVSTCQTAVGALTEAHGAIVHTVSITGLAPARPTLAFRPRHGGCRRRGAKSGPRAGSGRDGA
jgi:hypothetical protein